MLRRRAAMRRPASPTTNRSGCCLTRRFGLSVCAPTTRNGRSALCFGIPGDQRAGPHGEEAALGRATPSPSDSSREPCRAQPFRGSDADVERGRRGIDELAQALRTCRHGSPSWPTILTLGSDGARSPATAGHGAADTCGHLPGGDHRRGRRGRRPRRAARHLRLGARGRLPRFRQAPVRGDLDRLGCLGPALLGAAARRS